MSWNYRLMVFPGPAYEVVEVYYEPDNKTPRAWGRSSVSGETPDEAKATWELMADAFKHPPIKVFGRKPPHDTPTD